MKKPASTRRLGPRLRSLREDRDLDVGQLAYKAGLHPSTIRKIEAGDRPNASGVLLVRLADALDTTTDYLLGRTDDPAPLLDPTGTSVRVRRYVAGILDVWRDLEDTAPDLLDEAVGLLTSQTELLLAARRASADADLQVRPDQHHAKEHDA